MSVPASILGFWRGLVRPSPLSASVGVTVLVCLVLAYLLGARPAVLRPALLYTKSHGAWVTHLLEHPPAAARVAVVGASGAQESFDLPTLEQALGEPVLVLTSSSQTSFESLAVADRLPASVEVVLLSVSMNRLLHDEQRLRQFFENPRLGFTSSWEDDAWREELGWERSTWGVPSLDRAEFYLGHLRALPVQALKGRRGRRAMHVYRGRKQARPPAGVAAERVGMFEANHALHEAVFGRLIEGLEGRGKQVILLENPRCLYFTDQPEEPLLHRAYEATLERLVNEHGVASWNLDADADIRCEHFHDGTHLRSREAQVRYAEVLAKRLGGLP